MELNIEKNLILVKGQDKTETISYCSYSNGKYEIKYNRGKTYTYSRYNVQWYIDPVLLDPKATIVYQNNQPISGVHKIMDFGDYIRIIFTTGYQKVFRRNEIIIEENFLREPHSHIIFEYLKQLAGKVGIADEDDKSYLSKQYEEITHISPSAVLAKYLSPTSLDEPREQMRQMPIFPFGFNLSQKSATEKALTEKISIIEGPPGTGKTQTILNIISNAIMNEKTVAVVSNNNSATANVLEKLQKYEVDFIAAYLGNTENKEKFFLNQTKKYPNIRKWQISSRDYDLIKKTVEKSGNTLKEMLEVKNKVAILKQELSALTTEKEYFKNYHNETNEEIIPYRSIYPHNSDTIIKFWIDYQQTVERKINISLKYKLKYLFQYGVYSFSFYDHSIDKIIAFFQKYYYEKRIKELKDQIKALTKILENYQFDEAMKKYSEDSMKLFKAELAKRYGKKGHRKLFSKESLWKEFDSFIKEYPVIMSTTHSLRGSAVTNYLFDYVIMDEASQIDIVTGSLALSCAKKAVIVGDLKQLPNVVPEKTKEVTNLIFDSFSLDKAYNYAENSILSSVTKLFKDIPKTLLKEHYRCHPKIIEFCNQKFYNNELIILTDDNEQDKPLVAYKTAKGNHARGKYNQRQIDVILEEVLPQQLSNDSKKSIGIITPFRLQRDKLKATLAGSDIEVDTIHKYQGREKDIIILTTVVNEVNEFVDNPNLINVAVSRAVDKLIVVIADNEKNATTNLGDLLRYIEYNNFEIINSKIYSVFDLLYHRYSEKLISIMKKRRLVSKYESENLMYAVIEKVLALPEFSNLDCVMHQPLKMLIRNLEKLNDEECRFVMNILTHTDFVIFNRLDKMPVLVVEVDGYTFHENNPQQLRRDKIKDSILEKYGIPILRVRTNESGEERRLYNKLLQVLN